MAGSKRYDVAIIGLGAAGLSAAKTAAGLGLRVAAVERGRPGGDSLWAGCIPSKTLAATGRAAAGARHAARLGVDVDGVTVNVERAWERVRQVQDGIAATDDNLGRLRELGVDIREGPARLVGSKGVLVGHEFIAARRIVIATGSRPRIPDVAGLAAADPLTPDTLWGLPAPPKDMIILGAGPSGVELAQSFARIGSRVRLVHRHERVLPLEDPILAGLIEDRLRDDGVELIPLAESTEAAQVERGVRRLTYRTPLDEPNESGEMYVETSIEAPDLLVCCGRAPNLESLDIEGAGIDHGDEGILTDERSRTSARRVYAVGDVAGRGHTNAATFDAEKAIRDLALPGGGRRTAGIPWTVFTDPELAHAGLTFAEALRRYPRRRVQRYERDIAASDRGRTDADPPGRVVVVSVNGRVAGIHILAVGAGESAGGLQREVANRTRLSRLSDRMEAYPTRSLEVQRIAGERALERASRALSWLPRPRFR